MDCGAFQRDVGRVLGNEVPLEQRAEVLAGLRVHATSCADCRGSAVLLAWLELPPTERDIVEQPEEDYFEALSARVRERIRSEAAPGADRSAWRSWGAVAATVAALVVVGGLGWLGGPGSGAWRGESDPEPGRRSIAEMSGPGEDTLADDLDGLLDEVMPWNESDGFGDGGWLSPDSRELDPEVREALLRWLEEQVS